MFIRVFIMLAGLLCGFGRFSAESFRGRGVRLNRDSSRGHDQARLLHEPQENQESLLGLGALNAAKVFATTLVFTGARVCI